MGVAPRLRGKGKFRGGLGAVYEIELLEESATAFLFGERGKYAPQGVVGGEEGAKNKFYFDIDDKKQTKKSPPLISKITGINLKGVKEFGLKPQAVEDMELSPKGQKN